MVVVFLLIVVRSVYFKTFNIFSNKSFKIKIYSNIYMVSSTDEKTPLILEMLNKLEDLRDYDKPLKIIMDGLKQHMPEDDDMLIILKSLTMYKLYLDKQSKKENINQ